MISDEEIQRKDWEEGIYKKEQIEDEIKDYKGPLLRDDYPVIPGYIYYVGDEIVRSEINGTIKDLKERLGRENDICHGVQYNTEIDDLFL